MARQVIATVISDLSGEPGAKTARFGVDGVFYELDLTDEERRAFDKALRDYVSNARRVTPGRGARSNRPSGVKAPGLYTDIREAARRKGLTVNDRGRPGKEAIAAWEGETGRSFTEANRG